MEGQFLQSFLVVPPILESWAFQSIHRLYHFYCPGMSSTLESRLKQAGAYPLITTARPLSNSENHTK